MYYMYVPRLQTKTKTVQIRTLQTKSKVTKGLLSVHQPYESQLVEVMSLEHSKIYLHSVYLSLHTWTTLVAPLLNQRLIET